METSKQASMTFLSGNTSHSNGTSRVAQDDRTPCEVRHCKHVQDRAAIFLGHLSNGMARD
ncbi:hypothetical protein MFRU_019g00560 [Monilinia fructicola]|nr:hypothetical protein MFRU_019g00560 [Monilinia fructicola]